MVDGGESLARARTVVEAGDCPLSMCSSCRVVVWFHARMCPIPLLVWISTPGRRLSLGLDAMITKSLARQKCVSLERRCAKGNGHVREKRDE